ncbi:MAG: NFYB/HAP3 family transcription factor subunit [Candidatus Heimdallarchaeota archaeon]
MARHRRTNLPLAPIERIIKESTNMLVSESAAEELRKVLSDVAEELSIDAGELAVFAKRKTIKDRDIALAFRNMKKLR